MPVVLSYRWAMNGVSVSGIRYPVSGIRCRGIRGIHSTCSDKKIYALNIASNTVAYSFTVGACGDLVATPDGKSLYIGGSPTLFDITVATIATRSLAEPIFTGAPVGELTPSADRKKVYLSNGDDYGLFIIDIAAPQAPQEGFNTSHPPIASDRFGTVARRHNGVRQPRTRRDHRAVQRREGHRHCNEPGTGQYCHHRTWCSGGQP